MGGHGSGRRYSQFSAAPPPRNIGRAPGSSNAPPNGPSRTAQPGGPVPRANNTNRSYHSTVRCTVEACRSRISEPRKLFYPIPSNPASRKIWTDIIRQQNTNSGAIYTNYVCSDHFSADQKLPNGHLKGNAVPNVFHARRGVVDCLYCGMTFENRGRLHSHDSATHLHESRRWKLECEVVPVITSALRDRRTGCKECSYRVATIKQMEELRQEIRGSMIELNNFARTHLSGRLKLNLPPPSDDPLSLPDDAAPTSAESK
ncbi:hypothetical protein BIW11_09634 [Tropilaelaps mercedesae]|uniref:THAP-type domain-containing protein n=1 Tax=Tropilaelaps mercedesae TaxID=418985 RepID=A0A1V9XJ80_9ACAR|nr:hypothetical protein BIW11_09634 [Tropilaelaps mercedesae]